MDQTCTSKGRLTEKHCCTKNYLSDKITTSKMSKVVFVFNFLLFTSKRNSTVVTFEHKHIPKLQSKNWKKARFQHVVN